MVSIFDFQTKFGTLPGDSIAATTDTNEIGYIIEQYVELTAKGQNKSGIKVTGKEFL